MRALNDCIKENKKELTDEQAISRLRQIQIENKNRESIYEAIDRIIELYVQQKRELKDNRVLLNVNNNIHQQVLAERNELDKKLKEYKDKLESKLQELEKQHYITKVIFPNSLNEVIEEAEIKFIEEILRDE